jgi:hypothetical protein
VKITDPEMRKKFDRMLARSGGLYELNDIEQLINEGKMQSFVQGDTWIVTQVNEFPRRKVVEIVFVVGFVADAIQSLPQIYAFANEIGATLIMASNARDGWWDYAQPGWMKLGSIYAKEV